MTASTDLGRAPADAPASPPIAPLPADGAVPRRLYRSATNRKLSGVCGGIAEYYGSDPVAIRLAALVLLIVTGVFPGLLAYIVAALVIPERPATEPVAPVVPGRPGQGSLIVGVVLVAVGAIALAERTLMIDWDVLWPAALIAVGAVIAVAAFRR